MRLDAKALVRLIEGGSVPYRENAVAFIFECPRCSKKDKLYIRKRDGRFVCWVCREVDNFQGRAEWALRELYGKNIGELKEYLYGGDFTELPGDELTLEFDDIWEDGDDSVFVDPPLPEVCWSPDFVTAYDGVPFLKGFVYLHSRGISLKNILDYDIRYSPPDNRVVFPVKVDSKLIGWQARYINKTTQTDPETGRVYEIPKIITSDSLRDTGSRYLMFQDRLKGSEHCVLAEGPVSALKADLCGGNVASMGKAVSKRQLETILSYGIKKIYLALDPDAANEVTRIVSEIEGDVETYLLLPPEGREDLGDATPEEVYEQYKRAPRINRGTLMLSMDGNFIY